MAGSQKLSYYHTLSPLEKERKQIAARYYNARLRFTRAIADATTEPCKLVELKALFDKHAKEFAELNHARHARLNKCRIEIAKPLDAPTNFIVNFN